MQSNQEKILKALRNRNNAVLLDDLLADTGLSAADATVALTMLELNGSVRKNPDGRFVLPVSNVEVKRPTQARKSVKKPSGKRLEGKIIKVKICSSRYRDTASGQFVKTPTTTPTKVEFSRKLGAAARKWVDGTARARYTLEDKNGRPIPRVRFFSDADARAALKATSDPEQKKAIRKYSSDARRELQKQLRREYEADFLNKELRADVGRKVAARAVRTRADNKAKGKVPKNKPSDAVAQAAVIRLTRELPNLNARVNRAKTEKTRREATKRRDNAVKFLAHWRLVVSGKRSTYPKGWRK
jgi:hypothetical protein